MRQDTNAKASAKGQSQIMLKHKGGMAVKQLLLSCALIGCISYAAYSMAAQVVGGVDMTAEDLNLPTANLNADLDENAVFPHHDPLGKGVGAMPGRVVWTWNRDAVDWDDGEGYFWELDNYNADVIQDLVDSGIAALAAKDSAAASWQALFSAHNQSRRRGAVGYKAGEKIAIKVNLNGAAEYDDDPHGRSGDSYISCYVLKALLTSLVVDAKVPPQYITVYDVTRIVPVYIKEQCSDGVLAGVNFVDRTNGEPDTQKPIVWSQHQSPEPNYLPTCVTEATYLINAASLKGHNYGITLCAKNHFGSFINSYRLRAPQQANLHGNVSARRMNSYSVLVDLMGNYELGQKTMLYMLDGLICPSDNTIAVTRQNSTWQQSPFNGDYTNSLFFSQDPVAIDSVGADFLMNEPTCTKLNYSLRDNQTVENYLHEAALVATPPSKAVYLDGNGQRLTNLGVHEHWNNATDKKYSRNFGKSEGIELVLVDRNGVDIDAD